MRVRFFAYIRDFTGCAEADIPCREISAEPRSGEGSPPVTAGTLARLLCERYGDKLRERFFPEEFASRKSVSDKKSGAESKEETFGPEIIVLINGRHVNHLGGRDAVLNPDDRVDIFPVVAGG